MGFEGAKPQRRGRVPSGCWLPPASWCRAARAHLDRAAQTQRHRGRAAPYDVDGERVKVVAGSTTTVYLGGMWEEIGAGATKAYYTFNGQVVALRDSTDPDPVSYLHGDHLGSVSVASGAGASLLSSQRFDQRGTPEGRSAPTFGFTGELHDATAGMASMCLK